MSISKFPGGLITKNPVTPSGQYGTNTAPGIWTLSQATNYIKQGNWPVPGGPFDQYFNYVTALLHGDGTNGGQNNTFLDSSGNNYTITRNGNTTQGSFSPYGSLWSNYFDGSGDYLTTDASANFGMGTGTFTFECWVFPTANPANGVGTVFDARSGINAEGWVIRVFADRTVGLYDGPSNAYVYSTGTVTLNQWNHIAVVRSSTSSGGVAFYINGAAAGTATVASNLGTSWAALIGTNRSAGYEFNGYISNLRVVKGATVYTGAFTPSTTPLTTYGSGTNALLTCQSNRFIDNSGNSLSITPSGNTSVTNFAPFNPTAAYSTATNGGSGYFDGSGDWLNYTGGSISSGTDFTFSIWFYHIGTMSGNKGIFCSANSRFGMLAESGNNFYILAVPDLNTGTPIPINQWVHLAITRTSGTLRAFINGVQAGGTTSNTQTPSSFRIGSNSGGEIISNCYMSDARVLIGTGGTSITVPTSPQTAITNTDFLCNFTNAAIFDNSTKNDLETAVSAQISTSVKKYGTGSVSFDGSSWLNTAPTQNLEFGGGDFTIEFWLYPNSSSRQAIYHGSSGTDWSIGIDWQSQKICIWASSNGTSWNLINADGGGNGIGTTTVSLSTWTHVAFVRNGTTWQTYINGVRDLNLTGISGSIVDRASSPKSIGKWFFSDGSGNPGPLNGYIDDFRVTKGVARYTANFTPPTAAFPNQ